MKSTNKTVCYRCGFKKYNKRILVTVKCSKSDLHKGFVNLCNDDLHQGFVTLCNDCAESIESGDSLPWLTGLGEPTAKFVSKGAKKSKAEIKHIKKKQRRERQIKHLQLQQQRQKQIKQLALASWKKEGF